MATATTAGRLLNRIHGKSPDLLTAVLDSAAIRLETLDSLTATRLEVEDQLRLAAAVIELAPAFAREARRLHGQASAAADYVQGTTGRSTSAPLGSAHGRTAQTS